jgi:hypothetical protein
MSKGEVRGNVAGDDSQHVSQRVKLSVQRTGKPESLPSCIRQLGGWPDEFQADRKVLESMHSRDS